MFLIYKGLNGNLLSGLSERFINATPGPSGRGRGLKGSVWDASVLVNKVTEAPHE